MIRALRSDESEAYSELRRAALAEDPFAFLSSPEDDFASDPEALRQNLAANPESIILGAFEPDLVGSVGLYRDRHAKAAHKVYVWGMYVVPSHRRQGLALRLLEAIVDHARSLPGVATVHLTVSSSAPAAQALYERFGFRVWGEEPDALRYAGRSVVDHHMFLVLE